MIGLAKTISNETLSKYTFFKIIKKRKYYFSNIYFERQDITPLVKVICVSSQIGCVSRCTFCKTGELSFIGNLEAQEIISSIECTLTDKNLDLEKANKYDFEILFEGMGEPILNLENCIKVIKFFTENTKIKTNVSFKFSFSSYFSKVSELIDFIIQSNLTHKFQLQFSLHSIFDEKRKFIMPHVHDSISEIFNHLEKFSERLDQKIILNYLLLRRGNFCNFREEDIAMLMQVIKKEYFEIKFTLPIDVGFGYEKVADSEAKSIVKLFLNAGFVASYIEIQGEEINAGCGQLDYVSNPSKESI